MPEVFNAHRHGRECLSSGCQQIQWLATVAARVGASGFRVLRPHSWEFTPGDLPPIASTLGYVPGRETGANLGEDASYERQREGKGAGR